MRKLFPEHMGSLDLIPSTGPAPIMARVEEMLAVVPHFERLT